MSTVVDFLPALFVFFFNDTATTEIYPLSLHDALPIWSSRPAKSRRGGVPRGSVCNACRSEEHTSELQSRLHLVCRLLLEKNKAKHYSRSVTTHRSRPASFSVSPAAS